MRYAEPMQTTEVLCEICGSSKHSIGYDDSKTESKRYVLACPRCDAINAWPRWKEPKE